jgi:aminoglycoside 6'-N-acetyltransferase I
MVIRELGADDGGVLAAVAPEVFDHEVAPARVREFLADPRHHMVVALDAGRVVGFASGVHYIHPDKPPELWINEVAVSPTYHRRGISRQVVEGLLDVGRALGCVEAWVLTEDDNQAAIGLYESVGGVRATADPVMFSMRLKGEAR